MTLVRLQVTPSEAWQISNALKLITEGMLVQIQPFPFGFVSVMVISIVVCEAEGKSSILLRSPCRGARVVIVPLAKRRMLETTHRCDPYSRRGEFGVNGSMSVFQTEGKDSNSLTRISPMV